QEDIFWPVATLLAFDPEGQGIAIAQGPEYRPAASLWSRGVQRCHRVAAALDSGLGWLNPWMPRDQGVPMGGRNSSATGREGGWEAMRFFTEPKNVCVKY